MKIFNRLLSMLATVVVSAVLPFSLAAESEASQAVSHHSEAANEAGLAAPQDDETRSADSTH
ncbi:hypothetical protein [Salinicola avicenniae]|uniref:hypothetical protein n=1 Tax=Salinicola avicenniae TaxID=2916836 RepID=UPI002073BA01|nr:MULTISPECIES: hypothetical protein [unclassified Salinicola]